MSVVSAGSVVLTHLLRRRRRGNPNHDIETSPALSFQFTVVGSNFHFVRSGEERGHGSNLRSSSSSFPARKPPCNVDLVSHRARAGVLRMGGGRHRGRSMTRMVAVGTSMEAALRGDAAAPNHDDVSSFAVGGRWAVNF
jgi:hypothetical protein